MESLTNEIPVVSYRSSHAMESDAEATEQLVDQPESTDAEEQVDPNEQIACCWLDKRLTIGDLLFGIPLLTGGLAVAAWGFTNPSGDPTNATPTIVACCSFGAVLFLMGLAILLLRICVPSEGIEVTADGIARVTKRSSRKYQWSEIHKVLTSDFTATRLSESEIIVLVEPAKGKSFSFQTSHAGDPNGVLACLLANCDYIVRNPEGYTKNSK